MQKHSIALVLLILFLVAGISACGEPTTSTSSPAYREVDVSEAQALIEAAENTPDNLIILDVRTEGEYKSSHIPDAIVVPVSELEERLPEVSTNKNAKILVYDSTGLRSTNACRLLTENGFPNVYNLLGGFTDWIAADGPVVAESCGG